MPANYIERLFVDSNRLWSLVKTIITKKPFQLRFISRESFKIVLNLCKEMLKFRNSKTCSLSRNLRRRGSGFASKHFPR